MAELNLCLLNSSYENDKWPGYCENPMTYDEMRIALKECDDKWGISHDYEFRGHNINHISPRHERGEYPRPSLN